MSLRLHYNTTEEQLFNLTLVDNYADIFTGQTYSILFTHEQDGTEYMTGFTDTSLYPTLYNRFYIYTNLTGSTDAQQLKIKEQGWFKYEVYTWADRTTKSNRLELGQCYLADSTTAVQNTPDNTETYIEAKTKYVYSRD